MRIQARPSNPLEVLALAAGVVPLPLLDTQLAFTTARAIMAGVELGVFDALAPEPRDAHHVARECGTDPRATKLLLDALVGCRYLKYRAATQHYSLSRTARRWLLESSPQSLRDKLLFQKLEWQALAGLEHYVRSGQSLDLHEGADRATWQLYQRGMRALARTTASEVVARTPVPAGARDLLDIGGAAGVFSAALCRQHANLEATILDLPAAVEHAAPLLAEEGLGERVRHWPGDALSEDLGERRYDVVLLANLAHHFSEAQNRELAQRVARALRPGGVFVIHELVRAAEPSPDDQTGSAIGLYFGLTSRSGCWSLAELADWQRAAGLEPLAPIRYRTAPGAAQQAARKA